MQLTDPVKTVKGVGEKSAQLLEKLNIVTVEDLTGQTGSFLVVRPWTQFFKPQQRDDMPLSQCNDITMRRIKMTTKNFFDVGTSDKYRLLRFNYADIDVEDQKQAFDPTLIEGTTVRNVRINGVEK